MPDNFYYQYKNEIDSFIENALIEDIGGGDLSSNSCLDSKDHSTAQLLIKEKGRLAGITLAELIFKRYDNTLEFRPLLKEGDSINKGDIAFTIKGSAKSILSTERIVLNCIQRMSGIANLTFNLNQMIDHTSCKLLDTRKTTPNFRYPEKWAVRIGGGINHRMGLFDAIMIKDNHIDFCGGMTKTLEKQAVKGMAKTSRAIHRGQEIKAKATKIIEKSRLPKVYSFMKKQIDLGLQCMIVYPLVEESEKSDLAAAVEMYEKLKTSTFSKHQIGLVHGKMTPEEKKEVMQKFQKNEVKIIC